MKIMMARRALIQFKGYKYCSDDEGSGIMVGTSLSTLGFEEKDRGEVQG